MRRRLRLSALLLTCALFDTASLSSAQPLDEPSATPLAESPPPTLAPLPEEHRASESAPVQPRDLVTILGELRGAIRTAPDHVDARLKLAVALYRLGDLDAAIEESRAVLRLTPDHVEAHLQLGVALIAKQEWRAAASVLKEALRLDPRLTQAYYNLGQVQYSQGQIKGAVQSYREALELQPDFPDARYRLALLLKLTNREQDATRMMEEAAKGGVPQAQFFLGNAYHGGQGVEKNVGLAIHWWNHAVESGYQPAAEALSKLRRQALAPARRDQRKQEALAGFASYRATLRDQYPDVARTGDSLGAALLNETRVEDGLQLSLKEGAALDPAAIDVLARLYEQGREPELAPFDRRILACLETTALDGFLPAKKHVARIYAKGLGVRADETRAKAMMKDLPKPEATALSGELGLH